ncbi:dynamin family protein [Anabaena minutissima FACHB-250]|nr:dynamin family protein [Anabaena minutissima FACHB-250]
MPQNLQNILLISRKRLAEIFEKTNRLREGYPEMFNDQELVQSFNSFLNEYLESCKRLDRPALSIATLGTTSSGKSTIVNALIGRRIAPIEASEMSGGVLKIEYDSHNSLTVNKTQGCKWKPDTWNNLEDGDIYDKIKEIMQLYHKVRKETSEKIIAPDIVVKGSLLPHAHKELLGLSDSFEVEFIDLPGLKSVKDEANLEVIQTKVHKSFCLVSLDYLQTDDENRSNLLKELKQVVESLSGKTDSMIFLLNRVDARGSDDNPLENRIKILKEEIKNILNLNEYPDILPFSARLLYYAQCAWGAAPFEGKPSTSSKVQLELIKAMFTDCASLLETKYQDNGDLEEWFFNIKRRLRGNSASIEIEELRKILLYALDWSGGKHLWKRLQERLTTSFPEIVIRPAVFKVFQTHENLCEQVKSVIETRKVDSEKKAREELEKIDNVAIQLITKVEKDGKLFLSNLESAVSKLQQSDWKTAVGSLKELGEGFANLDETISNIKIDLINDIIKPISGYLQDNFSRSRDDLEDMLSKVVIEALAKEVARAYDEYSRKFLQLQLKYRLEEKSDVWELKIPASEPDVDEIFESVERVTKQLFDSVRDVLQARANFLIQAKASELSEAVDGIVKKQKANYRKFCDNFAPSFGFTDAVFSKLETSISSESLNLPDALFRLPSYPKVQETVENKTRYETRTVVEKKRKWYVLWLGKFDTEVEKQVRVVDEYRYKTIQLPNNKALAAEWENGIYDAEVEMWSALNDWIEGILKDLSASFSGAVDSTQFLIKRSLNEQIEMIRTRSVQTEQRLREVETIIFDVSQIRNQLEKSTRST